MLHQAGPAVAKKVYHLVHDRGYELGFIGGGVRTLEDFTEMVGGEVCITMNWNGSCDRLIEVEYFRDGFVDAWKNAIESIDQERRKANRSAP